MLRTLQLSCEQLIPREGADALAAPRTFSRPDKPNPYAVSSKSEKEAKVSNNSGNEPTLREPAEQQTKAEPEDACSCKERKFIPIHFSPVKSVYSLLNITTYQLGIDFGDPDRGMSKLFLNKPEIEAACL